LSEREARNAAARASRADSVHKKNGRRITPELRWTVYLDWKAGTRHISTLARKHGTSFPSMRTLVKEGNKLREWPDFMTQLAMENETLKSAQSIAAEKIAEQVLSEWDKARRNDLVIVAGTKGTLYALAEKLSKEMKTISFDRTVFDKDGNAHTVKMGATEALSNARTLAQAMDLVVKIESLLHDKPTENKKVVVEERWKNLTPDQLEFYAVNGKWPEGVNEDDVLGKAPAAKN
jgi:hypothetical protein